MKTWHPGIGVLLLFAAFPASGQRIIERGPNHVVREVEGAPLPGQQRSSVPRYTELATGRNYWNGEQWLETKEEFKLEDGRAVAQEGQLKVILAADIAKAGAVRIIGPDGEEIVNHPAGLSFMDTVTGENVIIAEIKSSIGKLIAPNIVLYEDCFDDVLGSIQVTYLRGSVEVDVILIDQKGLDPEAFGLKLETAQLQAWTEILEAPKPDRIDRVEEKFYDDRTIQFSTMAIDQGQAFAWDDPSVRLRVRKQWRTAADRRFLVEIVDFADLAPLLDRLPNQANLKSGKNKGVAKRTPVDLRQRQINEKGDKLMAGIQPGVRKSRSWVVLDYVVNLTASQTGYNFESGTTYYVSAPIIISGVASFESGTVIKFAPTNNASIKLTGTINWKGEPYAPVVLTARDDHTIGTAIGSASLSGYYATTALYIDGNASGSSAVLQELRIRYATTGIEIYGGPPHVMSHAQFVNCQTALKASNTTNSLRNALFHNVTNVLVLTNSFASGEHVTVNVGETLSSLQAGSTLALTNSLLVKVTTPGTYSDNQVAVSSSGSVFQTVGEGASYLANGSSYRNAGTSSINAALLADLAK